MKQNTASYTRARMTPPHLVQPVKVGTEPLVRLGGPLLTYLGNALLEDGLNAVLLDVVFAVLDGSCGGSHFSCPRCVWRGGRINNVMTSNIQSITRIIIFWLLCAYQTVIVMTCANAYVSVSLSVHSSLLTAQSLKN